VERLRRKDNRDLFVREINHSRWAFRCNSEDRWQGQERLPPSRVKLGHWSWSWISPLTFSPCNFHDTQDTPALSVTNVYTFPVFWPSLIRCCTLSRLGLLIWLDAKISRGTFGSEHVLRKPFSTAVQHSWRPKLSSHNKLPNDLGEYHHVLHDTSLVKKGPRICYCFSV